MWLNLSQENMKGENFRMNDKKEVILNLFKTGCSVEGITNIIYSQLKERENTKKASERAKLNRKDARGMVEQRYYEEVRF
ncbi:hypothetical protein SDC9_137909 [bioreactor metagenome]|uniref:Uncharacterized protein n=1 Tax=bioreactor metagenome TaxID=1076179 RepID=A0A645DNC4_9ZZZZ